MNVGPEIISLFLMIIRPSVKSNFRLFALTPAGRDLSHSVTYDAFTDAVDKLVGVFKIVTCLFSSLSSLTNLNLTNFPL